MKTIDNICAAAFIFGGFMAVLFCQPILRAFAGFCIWAHRVFNGG
jgi:hypothetical protein